MPEHPVGVKFERDGICVWIKIGEHCRAMIYPNEEDQLRHWLEDGMIDTSKAAMAIELKASRISA